MSDERKEFSYVIQLLGSIQYDLEKELAKGASEEIMNLRKRQVPELKAAIRLIQQKPEIDEEWLENKTFEMINVVSKGNILESMRFIKSIISDVKGIQVPIVKTKESRIKPERMDCMDKGALIGKPREVKIK